ncbi:hypothetical protein TYRP_012960 [Tyrophagus putrescentiae]|nr:hypothetical protein TYRP_012960 [Tyrophagus putrescentiae]
MNFNDLSDDNLLHVFAELPLSKLLSFSIVCHRWATLTVTALTHRDTLTLLIDERDDDPRYSQGLIRKSPFNTGQDLLAPDGVTPLKALYQLSRSFLKLTNKVRNDHLLIADLLDDGWSHRLVSFSLWSNFSTSKLRSSLLKVCNAPTKLVPALRHLTLDIGTFRLKPLKLPILSQLSSFSLASANGIESLLPTLADYQRIASKSQSKPKCSIDLPSINDLEMCFDSDLKPKARLMQVAPLFSRLTSKALSAYFYNHFAAHFSSLRIVNVDTYSCKSLSQLFLSLATLQQLTHLTMTLSLEMSHQDCSAVNLPSLQSVRWLTLRCTIADTDLAKCPLQHLFPSS